jgi:hypothetical protein
MPEYPFVPKTTAHLAPGEFWSIPLSDGRFACGMVLAVGGSADAGAESRTAFIGGIVDWVGDNSPTADAVAGSSVRDVGHAHVRCIAEGGGAILGCRPLPADMPEAGAIRSYWGLRYPTIRAEQLFVRPRQAPTWERREVSSPLTDEMLRPSATGHGVVQFNKLLTDADFERLAAWLRQYPEMTLRAYGSYDRQIRDLEFLRFFPFLRRFAVDTVFSFLGSLDGLRHLPDDVVEIGIGGTKRPLDLAVLARFRDLRTLYLEGQTKHIEVVSGLTWLEDVTLRSITLPDLSVLVPLQGLLSLDIKLGGTRDLRLLGRLPALRYLELWMIRGLTDIMAVGELPELRHLFLQALAQVDALPDLRGCASLRRVHLQTMKSLRDLAPLATAPNLEEVVLDDMAQLEPDDLRPLVGLPHMRAVSYGLGSFKKRDAARAIVGLPEVEGGFDWRAD